MELVKAPAIYKEGIKAHKEENRVLDRDAVKRAIAIPISNTMADRLVQTLKNEDSEIMRYAYLQNIQNLNTVLRDMDISIHEYVLAVQFVTRLIAGEDPELAFRDVFPAQVKKMKKAGMSNTDIARNVMAYQSSPLVIELLELAVVPVHLMYTNVYHKAINKQVQLMNTAYSETVQQKAAECLLNVLKPPEQYKVEMEITSNSSVIEELTATTRKLAEQQKKLLEAGADVKDLAESNIIDLVPVDGSEEKSLV
jgi:hypothetical protein